MGKDKPRSKLLDYLVYIAVRVVVAILQAIPLSMAGSVADVLGWLVYQVNRRHRRVADENLRLAFPGVHDEAERDRMVRAVYRHFCLVLIEIMLLPRKIRIHNWLRYFDVIGENKPILEALLSRRPLLLVTGHFGNWEIGGYTLALVGFPLYAVARDLDNPYLDAYLRKFRESTGQKILNKNGDAERMQEILANGGVIATLGDQDAGQRGLFVDFFGRPASSHKAIALLMLEYQVPLAVVGLRRVGEPLRYHLVVGDLIQPEEYADQPDAIRRVTERYTKAFESIVRQAPEQYFWLHRRWKHQPMAKKARKVA